MYRLKLRSTREIFNTFELFFTAQKRTRFAPKDRALTSFDSKLLKKRIFNKDFVKKLFVLKPINTQIHKALFVIKRAFPDQEEQFEQTQKKHIQF